MSIEINILFHNISQIGKSPTDYLNFMCFNKGSQTSSMFGHV